MATIFGSALSPMEKEAELMFMESAITMSKISTMENIVNSQFERAILECDYYAMKEGSSYDEYDRMIMEATIDKDGKEMGIIRSIINAIGSAINQIGQWIQKAVGADLSKLNNVPDDATGTMDGEKAKKLKDAVKFVPKALNAIKETLGKIEDAAKNHKALSITATTVAAFATSMGLGVFIDGSKASEDAKKEKDETTTKKTIDDYIRKWIGIQDDAKEVNEHANKVLELLTAGPKLVKDAAQKNINDAKAKQAAKQQPAQPAAPAGNGGNAGAQQAQPVNASAEIDHVSGAVMTESSYGLNAYDGLFMEAASKAFNNAVNATKAAIAAKDAKTAKEQLAIAKREALNNAGQNQIVAQLRKQINTIPNETLADANAKPSPAGATKTKTIPVQNASDATKPAYTNGTQNGVQNPSQAEAAYNSSEHKPDPKRGTAELTNKEPQYTADKNASDGKPVEKDQTVGDKVQSAVNAGKEVAKNVATAAKETVAPIFNKARDFLKQNKSKEAEQEVGKLKDFNLSDEDKKELDDIQKSIAVQKNGTADANTQENPDDGKLPWYSEAIAWLKAVLQVLALILPAAGKCLVDGISEFLKKVKGMVSGDGADVEDTTAETNANGDANANTDQNGQPAQNPQPQNAQPTGESVEDLFGIGEEYKEMMEGPEPETLQQFDQIIQDL